MPLEPLDEAARLAGREGFVQRCGPIGVEIVLDQYDLGGAWEVRV